MKNNAFAIVYMSERESASYYEERGFMNCAQDRQNALDSCMIF